VGRSFNIRSQLPVSLDALERITGTGHTTAEQLQDFLAANNSQIPLGFEDLPRLYIQECLAEEINHDIAFVQMCLETKFLKLGGQRAIDRHNFANLGNLNADWAEFETPELGVRAHVQQLKAYANTADLEQTLVAPRFPAVRRGVAPTIRQLPGRWSTDSQYSLKLLAMLRRLYEFTKVF
jgi:Mannosyl-glycoprotein endo-beta-N-acetylglucosaminidase